MTLEELFKKYPSTLEKRFNNFEKYTSRQYISRFLARYELFKKIENVKGNIIECGVYHGGGLMAWAKLSAIYEPYALYRKIIGFDTFEGFPEISENDFSVYKNKNLKINSMKPSYDTYDELKDVINIYNENRFLGNFEKVELIKGNATETIPKYIKENPELTIALLFVDFDLYEPTKTVLEYLYPRVVKGGIVVFDEINMKLWPGETKAVIEKFGNFNSVELKKFPFEPKISYFQV